jgi:hypothetical protein
VQFENIANDADSSTMTASIEFGALKLVGTRRRQTLEPGLKALQSLAPNGR